MRQSTVDGSVSGLPCAGCVASLEAALERLSGVMYASVNLSTNARRCGHGV
jgi:copper chaperone CopZ